MIRIDCDWTPDPAPEPRLRWWEDDFVEGLDAGKIVIRNMLSGVITEIDLETGDARQTKGLEP